MTNYEREIFSLNSYYFKLSDELKGEKEYNNFITEGKLMFS